MIYKEFFPSLTLRNDIRCFWTGGASSHLVIPDGCLDILFQFREGILFSSFLTGAMTRSLWVPNRGVESLGIRFQPGCAGRFFDFPISDITDRVIPLESLWGQKAKEWEEHLMELHSYAKRIEFLDRELLKLKTESKWEFRFFDWAWREAGRLSVADMARELGVSRQHLRRLSLAHSGLSPKEFLQISKVHRLSEQGACRFQEEDWGFYDQAHLIHQFKKYTGLTPGKYFQRPWQKETWSPSQENESF